jgi:hypothetical protein
VNAIALLDELRAAGITLSREGDKLRVRAKSGALAPYRERIAAAKPALLHVLAQRGDVESPSLASASPADSRILSEREAVALGLDPHLLWLHVPRCDVVEATRPPADWDGTLPIGCRYTRLCRTLGPCPHAATCGTAGEAS